MDVNFQFDSSSIVLIIRDENGNVLKTSKPLSENFLNMTPLDNNIYFDANHQVYWKKNIVSFLGEGNQRYYQEEYIDVTDLLLEKERLLSSLRKDPLTKIANLNAIYEMQKQIQLTQDNCVMVMCDVNDFKTINDVYGHLAGDQALVELSKLFNESIRSEDLVARIGGDEFFFLFRTNNINSILEKMDDIQNRVIDLGNRLSLPLSISLGVSYFSYRDQWEEKKKEADAALYCVKKNTVDKNGIAYFNRESGQFELYHKQKTEAGRIKF